MLCSYHCPFFSTIDSRMQITPLTVKRSIKTPALRYSPGWCFYAEISYGGETVIVPTIPSVSDSL